MWLTDQPLKLGFECKAGAVVVYVEGHETSPERLTLVLEAGREVGRRVVAAAKAARALTPAT